MAVRRGQSVPAAAGLATLALVAGCGSPAPSPSASTTSGSPALASPALASPALASPARPVAIDPRLLALLPTAVDGLAVVREDGLASGPASDPAIAQNAEALAAGIAVDPAAGEFAYATVVRLRPDVMTDAFFRDWRDSYDEGACGQSGGTSGNAEVELSGHQTFIGTCRNGVTTYHVWLAQERALVSVSAAGARRLGERLVADLPD